MPDDVSTLVVQFRDEGARAGLQGLQGELRATNEAAGGGGLALERFGDQASSLGTAVARTSSVLPGFYEGAEQAGLKAGGAERGMRRMEFALTAITTQSLGAQSGLMGAGARMTEAALLFGYGSEAVIGIGAGFAAFGLTLKAIDAPLEAVQKAAAKMTDEFNKLTTSLHPSMGAMTEVLGVAQQLQQVQEDAEPTFWQKLFSGIGDVTGLTAEGLNSVRDKIDAQQITAQSAEATAKSLRSVLDELVAIGQTKDLIRAVAAEMHSLGDVGAGQITTTNRLQSMRRFGAGAGPGESLFDAPGQIFGPPALDASMTASGTGLIGAQETAVAKARGMGWAKELTDATVESIDRDFVGEVGKSLKRAGENLTAIPVLDRMAHDAAAAVRASGVAPKIADELIAEIRAQLLQAIETMQKTGLEGPGALTASGRAREFVAGTGLTRFTAPTPFRPFGAPGPQDLVGTEGQPLFGDPTGAIRQNAATGLSSLGNVKALDDGARAAAEFAKKLDSASLHTEKFDTTIIGAIGAAVAAFSSGTPAGILGGAGGLLSTLAAAPGAGLAGLGLPGAILGLAGGLFGLEGNNSGPTKVIVSSYEATALTQMKALYDQLGQLITVLTVNSQGEPIDNIAYGLNRLTRRDAKPRIPQGVGG